MPCSRCTFFVLLVLSSFSSHNFPLEVHERLESGCSKYPNAWQSSESQHRQSCVSLAAGPATRVLTVAADRARPVLWSTHGSMTAAKHARSRRLKLVSVWPDCPRPAHGAQTVFCSSLFFLDHLSMGAPFWPSLELSFPSVSFAWFSCLFVFFSNGCKMFHLCLVRCFHLLMS